MGNLPESSRNMSTGAVFFQGMSSNEKIAVAAGFGTLVAGLGTLLYKTAKLAFETGGEMEFSNGPVKFTARGSGLSGKARNRNLKE